MKALPLWQPWASLVAIGAKRVETRHFPPERIGLRVGSRIAIYATKTFGDGGVAGYLDAITKPHTAAALMDAELPCNSDEIPRGVIVCTCKLKRASVMTDESIATLAEVNPAEHEFGLYEPGRWAWVLTDVERLAVPVEPPPGGSRQGTFDVPADLVGHRAPEPAQGSLL